MGSYSWGTTQRTKNLYLPLSNMEKRNKHFKDHHIDNNIPADKPFNDVVNEDDLKNAKFVSLREEGQGRGKRFQPGNKHELDRVLVSKQQIEVEDTGCLNKEKPKAERIKKGHIVIQGMKHKDVVVPAHMAGLMNKDETTGTFKGGDKVYKNKNFVAVGESSSEEATTGDPYVLRDRFQRMRMGDKIDE